MVKILWSANGCGRIALRLRGSSSNEELPKGLQMKAKKYSLPVGILCNRNRFRPLLPAGRETGRGPDEHLPPQPQSGPHPCSTGARTLLITNRSIFPKFLGLFSSNAFNYIANVPIYKILY